MEGGDGEVEEEAVKHGSRNLLQLLDVQNRQSYEDVRAYARHSGLSGTYDPAVGTMQ